MAILPQTRHIYIKKDIDMAIISVCILLLAITAWLTCTEMVRQRRMHARAVHVCSSHAVRKEDVRTNDTCSQLFTNEDALNNILGQRIVYVEVANDPVSGRTEHIFNHVSMRMTSSTVIQVDYYAVYALDMAMAMRRDDSGREESIQAMLRPYGMGSIVVEKMLRVIDDLYDQSNGNVVGYALVVYWTANLPFQDPGISLEMLRIFIA